ncbi:precorrin-2 C(20)-methyltransferase [Desulfotalea psychrophila]|uniref:Probable precorrin-2 C20-methyltransferase (CobI) n=1 Tax=Desulfotalea psychrophila (strain LSv54 / DSM 12343) TaxID=177439 RepID=Q6ART5_DESPS|nr:precorrin-2 C(20)-methyltransferase [Desulfotalea psychrophila]CAG34940.1 probable precorrin-2 C20-methyltransferase (CobI) [Desulfotalea psychrophila LSv54]
MHHLVAPKAHDEGESTALAIAAGVIEVAAKNILTHRFPMKHVRRAQEVDGELASAWEEAARAIIQRLDAGEDVAFPTLGDPAIYSTGFYVYEALAACGWAGRVEVIPGVSSVGASAASANMPLCLGDERLVVLPATFEDEKIASLLQQVDVAVFMKVYRVLPRIVELLESLGMLENAVLVERTSCGNERIWHDVRAALSEDLHYFSTLLVRKNRP